VLRTGGIIIPPLVIPVRADPSPTKRPNTLPAEIVEKKPRLVDIKTVEIPVAIIEPALIINVLNDVVTISPMLTYPKLPPIINELTVNDETNSCVVLIVLNIPNSPNVVLVVRLLITKLLANPALVDITAVEIFLAVKIPVLRRVVLRMGGIIDTPPLVIPVNPEPSPTNLAKIVPAEIVEKKP